MTQKWKIYIYIFLNVCICILVHLYLQYILFSNTLFKREILMINVDEWALLYVLLHPMCQILCRDVLRHKSEKKKTNNINTISVKNAVFPPISIVQSHGLQGRRRLTCMQTVRCGLEGVFTCGCDIGVPALAVCF